MRNTLFPSQTFIGFDQVERLLNTLSTDTTYPPYNVIRVDDYNIQIVLALAGFTKDEITVQQDKQLLEIRAEKTNKEETDKTVYLYKGIGTRSFTRKFALAEFTHVKSATFQDGLLTIGIETVIPEDQKPKVIAIS